MKTVLDDAYSWFLEKIAYEGNLTLFLIEAGLGNTSAITTKKRSLAAASLS